MGSKQASSLSSLVLNNAEIDHAVGHLLQSLAHGPGILDTKGFLGSGSVEFQIMAPVLRDLCSLGFEEACKLDEAILCFTLGDWVIREGLR